MGRLNGKRIVITGSSRSLGRHFALACAAEGASLIINGTNEDGAGCGSSRKLPHWVPRCMLCPARSLKPVYATHWSTPASINSAASM